MKLESGEKWWGIIQYFPNKNLTVQSNLYMLRWGLIFWHTLCGKFSFKCLFNIDLYHNEYRILYKLLFSRISRARPSRKFPLQFMSIYSNDNIRKIAKLTTRELPQKSKNAKITVRENNGLYSSIRVSRVLYIITIAPLCDMEDKYSLFLENPNTCTLMCNTYQMQTTTCRNFGHKINYH